MYSECPNCAALGFSFVKTLQLHLLKASLWFLTASLPFCFDGGSSSWITSSFMVLTEAAVVFSHSTDLIITFACMRPRLNLWSICHGLRLCHIWLCIATVRLSLRPAYVRQFSRHGIYFRCGSKYVIGSECLLDWGISFSILCKGFSCARINSCICWKHHYDFWRHHYHFVLMAAQAPG